MAFQKRLNTIFTDIESILRFENVLRTYSTREHIWNTSRTLPTANGSVIFDYIYIYMIYLFSCDSESLTYSIRSLRGRHRRIALEMGLCKFKLVFMTRFIPKTTKPEARCKPPPYVVCSQSSVVLRTSYYSIFIFRDRNFTSSHKCPNINVAQASSPYVYSKYIIYHHVNLN